MRSAIRCACTLLGVEAFVKDLDHDVSSDGQLVVRFERGACTWAWFINLVH